MHNDACLFMDRTMATKLEGAATFESIGAGFIGGCPDRDGTGARTAALTATNGDGRNDRCTQSGSQARGADGDQEFHARLNNNTTAGLAEGRLLLRRQPERLRRREREADHPLAWTQ